MVNGFPNGFATAAIGAVVGAIGGYAACRPVFWEQPIIDDTGGEGVFVVRIHEADQVSVVTVGGVCV